MYIKICMVVCNVAVWTEWVCVTLEWSVLCKVEGEEKPKPNSRVKAASVQNSESKPRETKDQKKKDLWNQRWHSGRLGRGVCDRWICKYVSWHGKLLQPQAACSCISHVQCLALGMNVKMFHSISSAATDISPANAKSPSLFGKSFSNALNPFSSCGSNVSDYSDHLPVHPFSWSFGHLLLTNYKRNNLGEVLLKRLLEYVTCQFFTRKLFFWFSMTDVRGCVCHLESVSNKGICGFM